MTPTHPAAFRKRLCLALALTGVALALGACNTTRQPEATGSLAMAPEDYRLRHPIVIQESNRSTEIFVGSARGGLTSAQRADVIGLGQTWLADGTGAIIAEVPVGTPNARAAQESLREIQTLLTQVGLPAGGVTVRQYHPEDPRLFATIRLKYPRIVADAGPCGTWPADLGPSIKNPGYLDNRSYHNFGCAYQRNMAAMVANPADLIQPRAETPAYTARRTAAFEKYRKGAATGVPYPESDKAKLSDIGK
jgi:pilus assembly protein CpaD